MKKSANHINVPEWLWRAIEVALYERLRELSATFQMEMSARMGLSTPRPWDKYFSKIWLDAASAVLDDFCKNECATK